MQIKHTWSENIVGFFLVKYILNHNEQTLIKKSLMINMVLVVINPTQCFIIHSQRVS